MKTVTLTDDQITVIRRSLKSSLKYADSEYINEVKRDSEQLDLIKAIQTSITDWNIKANIIFLLEIAF